MGFRIPIVPVPTPHDARDPVAFVVEHGGRRLGILTDLGHPFGRLREMLSTLDAAYLESNYDPVMLESGLDISGVITHRFSWRDYEQGFDAMRSGQCGKVILDWSDVK